MMITKPFLCQPTFRMHLLVLAALLVSCGPSVPVDRSAEPAPFTTEAAGKAPFKIWIATEAHGTDLQTILERSSQQAGLPVQVEFTSPDQVTPTLSTAAAPDLVVLSTISSVAYWGSSGFLVDLSSMIEPDTFFPAAVEACTVEGRLFCLPWSVEFQVLLWNKRMFSNAGLDPETPPSSLEELAFFGDKLTRFGPYGRLEQLGFLPTLSVQHLRLTSQLFGGYWVSPDGLRIRADDPRLRQAMIWQQQFYYKYDYENVVAFLPGAVNLDVEAHPFHDGRLGMVIADWDEVGPASLAASAADHEIGFAPVPPSTALAPERTPLMMDGLVLIVPANAPHSAEILPLLEILLSDEVAHEVASLSDQFPASQGALEISGLQAHEAGKVFIEILKNSRGVAAPTTPLSPELESALLQIGELTLYQGVDPEPLLAQVQSEFAPRLDQILRP